MICRGVRRLQREYRLTPISPLLGKLFRSNETLAARASIVSHQLMAVTGFLKEKRKRGKKGKRLNLIGMEDTEAQFFSSGKIQAAKDYQTTKEKEETQQKEAMEARKTQAQIRRQEKEDKRLRNI